MKRGVEAIVVNTIRRGPGQMQGLGADGSTTDNLLNIATGGTYSELLETIDTLTLLLKVTVVASVISGIAAVAVLAQGRR